MQISPSLSSHPIEVAFGSRREEMFWRNKTLTVGELITRLSTFRRGDKNGACLTQGPLFSGRRVSKNVISNFILMVDCDTGETLDEIAAKIREHDLAALLWTTYSHLKPFTLVSESQLLAWVKKQRLALDAANLVNSMKRYLQTTGKVKQSIIDSITGVDRELADGGVRFIVHHAPMPRARALFILDKSFDFGSGKSQDSQIAVWKQKVSGVCNALNLAYDKSCVDPARLMYMPVMAKDARDNDHEVRWIDGGFLDLDRVPCAADASNTLSAFFNAPAQPRRLQLKTPGLAVFLKKHGNGFDAAEFLRTVAPDDIRSDTDGKVECECPNDDSHSNAGDPSDRAFFATDSIGGNWTMYCHHDACISMSSEQNHTGRPDRAWYLDLACQKYDIQHADDLLPFTSAGDSAEASLNFESRSKTTDIIRAEIETLDANADGAAVDRILLDLARLPPSTSTEQLLKRIARNTGMSVIVLRSTLQSFARAQRDENNELTNVLFDAAVPSDEDIQAGASTVWAGWGHDQKIATAKKIFEHQNHRDPNIYCKNEGGLVRVSLIDGKPILEEANSALASVWTSELNRTVTFMRIEDGREENVPPFSNVVAEFVGSNSIDLPVIASVSSVPVFAADGSIETAQGYNRKTRCFLHPNAEFRPIPPKPSQEEVVHAFEILFEPLRDFPFTDKFDGSDALPIRDGEHDPSGFPYPNWDRGYVSRLHAIAMILQPFARNLIKGPCPIYHVDKSAAGTGAGYLVDVSQIILTGQRAEIGTMNHNSEEFRKEITATLRSGRPTIFLDNVNKHVDDAGLAAALTGGTWKGRILGKSEEVAIPIHATWIMAGNNLSFSSELMRRVCPIRMDAAVPDPATDRPAEFYKHEDIHQWCADNRVDLVWACHVAIQNWIARGRPSGACTIQSFTQWSRTMSGILEAAGYPGFMETAIEYRAMKNDEQSDHDKFAEFLFGSFSTNAFTVKEAYDASLEPSSAGGASNFGGAPQFRFSEIPLTGNNDHARRCSLGTFFTKHLLGKTFRMNSGETFKLTKLSVKRNAYYQFAPTCSPSSSSSLVIAAAA